MNYFLIKARSKKYILKVKYKNIFVIIPLILLGIITSLCNVIEVILNQELGELFRRDAMKKQVRVDGVKKEDMRKQPSLVS